MELRQRALDAFKLHDPADKAAAVQALWQLISSAASAATPCASTAVALNTQCAFPDITEPGRPLTPELVSPQAVPRRSPFTAEGHSALVHAIAHIEFNALNLALDAIWRFEGMPSPYYYDWLKVAAEEAKHFTLLNARLISEGYAYGDFVAHDGLWTMCAHTRHDIVARMALVPRTLEARGLDATPIIQTKLRKVGTPRALAAVAVLDIILAEEVGHVAIGNYWYLWLCQQRALDPEDFYQTAALRHHAPRLKPPFNIPARRLAGFSEQELLNLSQMATT